MELLFVLILILFIVSNNNLKNIKQEYKPTVTMIEKKCPPHKWRYEDILSQEGVVQSTRIVCDNCGPLKSLSAPERMDY